MIRPPWRRASSAANWARFLACVIGAALTSVTFSLRSALTSAEGRPVAVSTSASSGAGSCA